MFIFLHVSCSEILINIFILTKHSTSISPDLVFSFLIAREAEMNEEENEAEMNEEEKYSM